MQQSSPQESSKPLSDAIKQLDVSRLEDAAERMNLDPFSVGEKVASCDIAGLPVLLDGRQAPRLLVVRMQTVGQELPLRRRTELLTFANEMNLRPYVSVSVQTVSEGLLLCVDGPIIAGKNGLSDAQFDDYFHAIYRSCRTIARRFNTEYGSGEEEHPEDIPAQAASKPAPTGYDDQPGGHHRNDDPQRAERLAEQQAKKKAEQEAKEKAEQEAKAKAAEEQRKKAAEAEAKKKAALAEAERKAAAEAEAKKKAAEEARRKAEEEARKKAEEVAAKKAEAARLAKQKAEKEAAELARRQQQARRSAEAEAKAKQQATAGTAAATAAAGAAAAGAAGAAAGAAAGSAAGATASAAGEAAGTAIGGLHTVEREEAAKAAKAAAAKAAADKAAADKASAADKQAEKPAAPAAAADTQSADDNGATTDDEDEAVRTDTHAFDLDSWEKETCEYLPVTPERVIEWLKKRGIDYQYDKNDQSLWCPMESMWYQITANLPNSLMVAAMSKTRLAGDDEVDLALVVANQLNTTSLATIIVLDDVPMVASEASSFWPEGIADDQLFEALGRMFTQTADALDIFMDNFEDLKEMSLD